MRKRPLEERFWEKIDKHGPTPAHCPELGPCWPWTAGTNALGYGRIGVENEPILAHRVAWELAMGPIPDGMEVCHHCDNPPCCNSAHLFLGAHIDNMRDRDTKGRVRNRATGERHPDAVLTWADVREIRRLYASGRVFQRVLAARYGVRQTTIGRIVVGKNWKEPGMQIVVRGKNPPGPRQSLTIEEAKSA
jgi:hypothetical protein